MIGDTGPFERDWWADGWKDDFPAIEVAIPTALTFSGNVGPDGGISATLSFVPPGSCPKRSAGETWWSRKQLGWAPPTGHW